MTTGTCSVLILAHLGRRIKWTPPARGASPRFFRFHPLRSRV